MKVYFIQRLGFIILDISPEHYGSIQKKKENEKAVVEKKAISSRKASQEVREIAASIYIYIYVPYRWSLNTVLSTQNNLWVL